MKATALKMPEKYVPLNEEEMTYLNGGAVTLRMERRFGNKNNCIGEAQTWIGRGALGRISALDAGIEIFAHALVYYKYGWFQNVPFDVVQGIYNSAANGIQVDDRLDHRAGYFNILWRTHQSF